MSEHVRDRLGEFLVGALDAAESERVAAHLAECAECGGELALLHGLEESLGKLRPRPHVLLLVLAAALAVAAVLFFALVRPAPRPESAKMSGPLALADGSRIEARPAARLEILGPRDVSLVAGRAFFSVVPAVAPFTVETPRGTVVVLGTQFAGERGAEPRASFGIEIGDGEMNGKIPTAAAVVTVTVVSGAILWKSAETTPKETSVPAGQQVVARLGSVELKAAPAATEKPAEKPERVAALEKENAELRAQLALASKKTVDLETRFAELSSRSPAAAAPEAPQHIQPQEPAAPRTRFSFGPRERTDKLAKIDWRTAAEASRTLGPALKQLLGLIAKGDPIPPELAEKVHTENAKLIKVALAVQKELPTYGGANGAYTHPLVLANLMASHLELAGVALDDAQTQKMNAIGAEYEERWTALQGTYTQETLALEKFADELEMKRLYVRQIDAVFTPQQTAALFDPETKDLMSHDLYSPVLMCAQWARPVSKPKADSLKRAVAKAWVDLWELGDKNVDALADSFVSGLGLAPSKALAYTLDEAVAAARGTIGAEKEALRTLALDDETAKGIRESFSFAVPRLADK